MTAKHRTEKTLTSAFYTGNVFHSRYFPKKHKFTYNIFMVYLNLDELETVFKMSKFWGDKWFHLARFKRSDFFQCKGLSLKESVVEKVQNELGITIDGDIFMLANLRYFGYMMNPLVTYYCFDKTRELKAVLAEVNNTPWGEKHVYALPVKNTRGVNHTMEKAFTVSPFNPINMEYRWQSDIPGKNVKIAIDTMQGNTRICHASINMSKKAITTFSLNTSLFRYPFHSVKIICLIYIEALRLALKGVPFLGKNKRVAYESMHNAVEK